MPHKKVGEKYAICQQTSNEYSIDIFEKGKLLKKIVKVLKKKKKMIALDTVHSQNCRENKMGNMF